MCSSDLLDANNERAIIENLDTFYRGKTVVIVAHRLSTVRNADQIVTNSVRYAVSDSGDMRSLVFQVFLRLQS